MPKIAAATVAEHRENVLAALVDASERILRAGDPLTAGVVSSAAGIARNSIYRYVESVDDLRVLVLERYLPGWERAVTTALAPLDDPGDRVVEWVRVIIRQAHLTGHGWFITMAREASSSAAMRRSFPRSCDASCAPLTMSTANGAVTISVTRPYSPLACDASARAHAFGR